jgi:hypothetical protein
MYKLLRSIREYAGEHPLIVGVSLVMGVTMLAQIGAAIYLRDAIRSDRQAILFSIEDINRLSHSNTNLQSKLNTNP